MAVFSLFYYIFLVLAIALLLRICIRILCLVPLMNANASRRTSRTEDRQGNVLTIPDENSRERRYDDIFFIEPNSIEAARIRAQLEKDDLPSYEEVIRMANLAQPTAAPAASSVSTLAASNTSVNTTDTILPVPPYSEVDPYASTSRLTTATSPTTSTTPTANSGVAIAMPITTPIGTHTSSNV